MLAALPVETRGRKNTEPLRVTSFRLHRSQCLNCSRHPCVFHTRSVIALFSSLVLRLSSACHTVCNKERSLLDPCALLYGIINLVQLCFLSPLDFSGCFHSSPVLFRTASSPLVSFQSNRNRVGLSTQKKQKKPVAPLVYTRHSSEPLCTSLEHIHSQ